MRRNKKQKKSFVVTLCLLITVVLGIGYAVLSQQLSINGGLEYGTMKWDVGFSSATNGGGTINSNPTIADDKKSITITCDIGTSTASETCIAKVKIKNGSSFAVELESNPTITFDNTYINSVTAVWTGNNENVVAGNILGTNTEEEITITISTKELTKEMLPESTLSLPVTITMDWVEDGTSEERLVTYEQKQIFPNIEEHYPYNKTGISSNKMLGAYTPLSYEDLDIFSGKNITKIGIPVESVAAIDENQTFTLHKVDKEKLANNQATTIIESYELKLPVSEITQTIVKKWVYVDLTDYNIVVGENETLAFGSSSDTVTWAYVGSPGDMFDEKYAFIKNVITSPIRLSEMNMYFDIYYKGYEVIVDTPDPSNPLKNKNVSILGDSISSYDGYSNDCIYTNNTTCNNGALYPGNSGLTSVNDTWWMQTINSTGMNLLVNNAVSNDTIANSMNTRALQLHDNTGANSGTNPDIIAIHFGINDVRRSTLEDFSNNYRTMISNVREKYTNADIFVFTYVPFNSTDVVPEYNNSSIEVFNNVVRSIANETENCYVVDLYADSGITKDNLATYMFDGTLHPNVEGMTKIADTFINKLEEVYLNKN